MAQLLAGYPWLDSTLLRLGAWEAGRGVNLCDKWMSRDGSGWINGDRIHGLFHLLISGIYILGL